MRQRGFLRLLGGCSLLAMAVSGWPAAAQDREPAQDSGVIVLDQIILVGEKISRSLNDTAASVSVISERDLDDDQPVDTVEKAIEKTPNLTYTGTVGAPIIRGQDSQGPNSGAGAFFGGTVPRASINVDGRYLSYNEYAYGAASVWDVAGIEVFRGAQTTSQGANSIAGAIIVHTKDPTFTPEGAYQLEVGSNKRRRASLAG